MLEATTGEDGVRLAREHFPQLVLTDIQLPGISGIEALRELRGDPRTSQIPHGSHRLCYAERPQ